jgi:hypothetical protein
MTNQQLRDLLHDRVADETMPDLSGAAWQAGSTVRRRRRTALVAGAAAGVVAVVAVTATLGGTPAPDTTLPSGSESLTPALPPSSEPDATYQGVPVWWSPDQVEERSLPVTASPLPEEIDLEAGPRAKQIDVAVAAFGIGDQVRLVDERGAQVSVDASSLDDVVNENGYPISPIGDSMLSPDGRHLAFPQVGSVVVYELATGGWSGFSTEADDAAYVEWRDDRSVVVTTTRGGKGPAYDLEGNRVGSQSGVPPFTGFDTGEALPFGPTKVVRKEGADGSYSQARSWGMGVPLPVRTEGDGSSPEFLSAEVLENIERADRVALAFMNHVGDGQDTRWKDCCPVAGWLDPETVVYESRQSRPTLVAWTVATDEFRKVTEIVGSYDVASFASLQD